MEKLGICADNNTIGYHERNLTTAEGVYYFHWEDVKKLESQRLSRIKKIKKIQRLDKGSLKEFDDYILSFSIPALARKAYKRGCKIFLQIAFYDLFLGV